MRTLGGLLLLLAVAAAAIWGLLSVPQEVLVWLLVVAYVLWPVVWLFVKPILMAPVNVFMPAPLGKQFQYVALLGVRTPGGRLDRARIKVAQYLASYVEVALWPAAGLTGRTLHTVATATARVLYPNLWMYAAVSALFALILVGLRASAGPSDAVTVAAVALLVTMTARHVLWVVSGDEFRRLLRRSLPDPYVTLVTLAVFDCIALIALAIVLRWNGIDGLDPARVVAEGRDVFSLRHVTRLADRPDLSPVLAVLAAAVTAYWASLASQVLKFPAFRRDYDDRAWLAALRLDEGSDEEARKWLAPVPRTHVTGPVLQVRIRLAVAGSEVDEALRLSRALVQQLDPEHASEEGALVYLTTQMAEVADGKPADAWQIIRLATAADISDGAMFVVLRNVRFSGFYRVEGWESAAKSRGLTAERHPIAWSWLQASTGSLDDALRTLDAARPATEGDVAVRQIARQETVREKTFRAQREDVETDLVDTLRILSGLPLERLPYWLRDFLLMTTWRLEQRARDFDLTGRDDLRAMRRRLLALPAGTAEAILDDFDRTERARLLAAQTGHDLMFGARPW